MSGATFTNTRILPFPKEKIQKAWTTPELLATWWGPAGFSNEFEVCDIRNWGDWIFTMIAPDGTRYTNKSIWHEVSDNHILIEHIVEPHFFLRADFEEILNSTKITWTMTFDSSDILEKLKPIIEPANEQNLDRLEACLKKIN